MKNITKKIAAAAVVAAAYAALSMLLAPISFGPVQFRISEVICILPFFMPFMTWGVTVGCLITNLMSMYGPLDLIFGTLATLLSALCMARLGRAERGIISKIAACFMPVIFNGVIIGAVIAVSTASKDAFWAMFAVNGASVAFGEAVVMYALGLPLMIYLPKKKMLNRMIEYMQ